MLNYFRNKKPLLDSFSFLHTDMHSHLVPGVDDGAPDVATSVALVRKLQALGYRALITTPHVMADLYPNTPEIIMDRLAELKNALKKEKIDIPIEAAAEYLMDDAFAEKIVNGRLLTLKDKYVLVEMSFISPPPDKDQLLFQLQTKGFRPVMAHPERYMYYQRDLSEYEQLKDRGCLLQLNLLSLTGYYGREVRQTAVKMIRAGLFDLAGTDLHHEQHALALAHLLKDYKATKLLADYPWQNAELLSENG